jgi:hypothetical protein
MRPSGTATNVLSIIIGAFLVLVGIWGLFSDEVFGMLATNTTHSVLLLLLGGTAIILGIKQRAKGFSIFLGLLLLIVGLLWFIRGADALVINLLNVNRPAAYLNFILAALLLATAAYKRPGKLDY